MLLPLCPSNSNFLPMKLFNWLDYQTVNLDVGCFFQHRISLGFLWLRIVSNCFWKNFWIPSWSSTPSIVKEERNLGVDATFRPGYDLYPKESTIVAEESRVPLPEPNPPCGMLGGALLWPATTCLLWACHFSGLTPLPPNHSLNTCVRVFTFSSIFLMLRNFLFFDWWATMGFKLWQKGCTRNR